MTDEHERMLKRIIHNNYEQAEKLRCAAKNKGEYIAYTDMIYTLKWFYNLLFSYDDTMKEYEEITRKDENE